MFSSFFFLSILSFLSLFSSSLLSHAPFMLVTMTRSASYLMVEMLDRPDLGIYCAGEIFNPMIPDSYGYKLSITSRRGLGVPPPKVTWNYLVESLRDFYGKHSDTISGYKMMIRSANSPTNRIILDLFGNSHCPIHLRTFLIFPSLGIFPTARAVFLFRDVFDNTISFMEATRLKKWVFVNESGGGAHYRNELDTRAVMHSKEDAEKYLSHGIELSFNDLARYIERRFAAQRDSLTQHEDIQRKTPHLSYFVRSEDIMNPDRRRRTMEGVYAFLLNITLENVEYKDLMKKALDGLGSTVNQRGRSGRTIEQRVSNWQNVCKQSMEYFKQKEHPFADWESYLQRRMADKCPISLPSLAKDEVEEVTSRDTERSRNNENHLGPGGIILPSGLQMPNFDPVIFRDDRLKRSRKEKRSG